MSGHDISFELDRADRDDDSDPVPRGTPVDGEVRLFTVTLLKRVSPGRFWLPSADTLVLFCGLWGAWEITRQPAGGWLVGETRTLPEPIEVSATWGADGWRVTRVGTP